MPVCLYVRLVAENSGIYQGIDKENTQELVSDKPGDKPVGRSWTKVCQPAPTAFGLVPTPFGLAPLLNYAPIR